MLFYRLRQLMKRAGLLFFQITSLAPLSVECEAVDQDSKPQTNKEAVDWQTELWLMGQPTRASQASLILTQVEENNTVTFIGKMIKRYACVKELRLGAGGGHLAGFDWSSHWPQHCSPIRCFFVNLWFKPATLHSRDHLTSNIFTIKIKL